MNTNSSTVIKLSEALNNLIKAYEELQEQKNEIEEQKKEVEEKNIALQEELAALKNEKDNLTTNVEELNQNTEKQETNINSMLGKIESLLGVKPKKELKDIVIEEKKAEENITEANHTQDEAYNLNNSIFNTNVNDTKEEKIEEGLEIKKDDSSLDLNRMATLLNGFNK